MHLVEDDFVVVAESVQQVTAFLGRGVSRDCPNDSGRFLRHFSDVCPLERQFLLSVLPKMELLVAVVKLSDDASCITSEPCS